MAFWTGQRRATAAGLTNSEWDQEGGLGGVTEMWAGSSYRLFGWAVLIF